MLTILTTAVEYCDYLQETLPYMTRAAERVIVITAPSDPAVDLARDYGATVHVTEAFFSKGTRFAKGTAINCALQRYKPELRSSWILHLDADMLLLTAPETRRLNLETLYGQLRRPIIGQEALQRFVDTGVLRHHHIRTILRPIGFFQLWHGSNWQDYPTRSDNASWDDMEFIKQFRQVRMLPGHCYHLQTTDLRRRGNWGGRTTKLFS